MSRRNAFTLIELLVSISIMALLISILLPSFSKARANAKFTVCASNMREMGVGVLVYTNAFRGRYPVGPDQLDEMDFIGTNENATNAIWYGSFPRPEKYGKYTGLGLLLKEKSAVERSLFCPADDTFDLKEQIGRIGKPPEVWNAYCSYWWRQFDFVPDGYHTATLDRMGTNVVDDRRVKVEALSVEAISYGPDILSHTNHEGKRANVLYRDGSVEGYDNGGHQLSFLPEHWVGFPGVRDVAFRRLDQIWLNVDYAYKTGTFENAPQLDDD